MGGKETVSLRCFLTGRSLMADFGPEAAFSLPRRRPRPMSPDKVAGQHWPTAPVAQHFHQ